MFGSLDPLRYLLHDSNDERTWAVGVIDLVEMRSPSEADLPRDHGLVPFLLDNKTRTVATVPGFAQKRTSRLQLMLYKFLFDGLVSSRDAAADWIEEFLQARDLDPLATATAPDVVAELDRYGLGGRNLLQICTTAVDCFRAVSQSSRVLQVVYELQGTGVHLGDDTWTFDYDHLQCDVGHFMEFWTGFRGPRPVL